MQKELRRNQRESKIEASYLDSAMLSWVSRGPVGKRLPHAESSKCRHKRGWASVKNSPCRERVGPQAPRVILNDEKQANGKRCWKEKAVFFFGAIDANEGAPRTGVVWEFTSSGKPLHFRRRHSEIFGWVEKLRTERRISRQGMGLREESKG